MTRDKTDTSGTAAAGGSKRRAPKRPARTIDLEAEEVDVTPAEGAAAAAEEKTARTKKPAAPDDKPDKPAKDEDKRDKDDSTVSNDSADDGTAREAAGEHAAPPPPPRARPSDARRFVTHMAAGLAGGLIGVIGAGIALDRLPFAGNDGGAVSLPRVEQRIAALEARIGEQAKALDTATKPEALAALQRRLAALEQKPASAAAPDLAGRVGKLEDTLQTLQASGGGDNASALAQSAALTEKIEEVSTELEKRAGALGAGLDALRQSLEARAASAGSESSRVADAVTGRLDDLEQKLDQFSDRLSAAAARAGEGRGGGALRALALTRLRRAFERGEPFAQELEIALKAVPEGFDAGALRVHAETGAATERALLRELGPLLGEARRAAARSGDRTLLDRLATNAQAVVRIRRVGPVEGDGTRAVLARMETAADASDLPGVLGEAEALSGAARAAIEPWLARARARRAGAAALDDLERRVLENLTTSAEAQR